MAFFNAIVMEGLNFELRFMVELRDNIMDRVVVLMWLIGFVKV